MTKDASGGTRVQRLRHVIRRSRARTRGFLASFRFLLYAYLGRVDEVWIGDSHAVLFNSPSMTKAVLRLPERRWVIHLGPRLMHSIARNGLPPAVLRLLRRVSRTPRAKDIIWGFSFGEIDVRRHLAQRMHDPDAALAFVPTYLAHLQSAATSAGARRVLVLIPPPQSATYSDPVAFPSVGTLAERTEANRALHDALIDAAATLPADGASLILVDVTREFSDERGAMREDRTFDGLHANDEGRAVFRTAVDEVLAETSA
jgi:lysophospholipase L1-like esterase